MFDRWCKKSIITLYKDSFSKSIAHVCLPIRVRWNSCLGCIGYIVLQLVLCIILAQIGAIIVKAFLLMTISCTCIE
jgi:hypothetical protein